MNRFVCDYLHFPLGTIAHGLTSVTQFHSLLDFIVSLVPQWRALPFLTLPTHHLAPTIMSRKRKGNDGNNNDSQPSKKPRRSTFRVANKPKNQRTVNATTLRTHTSGHIGRRRQKVKVVNHMDGSNSSEVRPESGHVADASSSSACEGNVEPSSAGGGSILQDPSSEVPTKQKRRKRINTTSVSTFQLSLLL